MHEVLTDELVKTELCIENVQNQTFIATRFQIT